nr:bet1-like SNARE 1-1 [Ipomoea batatas]
MGGGFALQFGACKARTALFDGIEEGGIRASLSYSSHEIDEHENEKALEGLQDRVNLLKRPGGYGRRRETSLPSSSSSSRIPIARPPEGEGEGVAPCQSDVGDVNTSPSPANTAVATTTTVLLPRRRTEMRQA